MRVKGDPQDTRVSLVGQDGVGEVDSRMKVRLSSLVRGEKRHCGFSRVESQAALLRPRHHMVSVVRESACRGSHVRVEGRVSKVVGIGGGE